MFELETIQRSGYRELYLLPGPCIRECDRDVTWRLEYSNDIILCIHMRHEHRHIMIRQSQKKIRCSISTFKDRLRSQNSLTFHVDITHYQSKHYLPATPTTCTSSVHNKHCSSLGHSAPLPLKRSLRHCG
jgi:hypothetical protein